MRWLGFCCTITLVTACGGEPVGSHVPRPNPSYIAAGAAAAATALTVADPDSARKKPEKAGEPEQRPKASGGSVPADVLDRADDGASIDPDESERCKPAPEVRGLELVPRADRPTAGPERCAAPEPDEPDERAADDD